MPSWKKFYPKELEPPWQEVGGGGHSRARTPFSAHSYLNLYCPVSRINVVRINGAILIINGAYINFLPRF